MQNNKYQSKYKGKEIDAALDKIYNNDFTTKEYVEALTETKMDKTTGKTSEIINDGDGTSPFATQNFVTSKMAIVYKYKGSILELSDLPTECEIGDVYNVVNEQGKNFAWTGNEWDDIGGIVDLSEYTDPNLYTDENIIDAINHNHQSVEEVATIVSTELVNIETQIKDLNDYDMQLSNMIDDANTQIININTAIGNIDSALDELHNYAQGLILPQEVEAAVDNLIDVQNSYIGGDA